MQVDFEEKKDNYKLDLSKLKVMTLPRKTVEVAICGEPQKVTIRAFNDEISLRLPMITENFPTDGESRIRALLLEECAGLDHEQAVLLLENDGAAAGKIVSEIFKLTDDFYKSREEMRKEAEKNLEAGAAENTRD